MTQGDNLLGEQDVYLFREGTHSRLYSIMGCVLGTTRRDLRACGRRTRRASSVIGEFNGWDAARASADAAERRFGHLGRRRSPASRAATPTSIASSSADGRYEMDKADPFALCAEVPAADRVARVDARLRVGRRRLDGGARSAQRARRADLDLRSASGLVAARCERDQLPTYREIAQPLAEYVRDQGFTHVELMPVTEHPFYGSWGYQTTGYFAPTARYGTPQDFMYLVDVLHQHGIGVILDWVPSHFPTDAHGLAYFDGTHLYEHADPRQGFHPEWNSSIFNYGRHEVRAFLLSSALFWLDRYHVDGLRVDARRVDALPRLRAQGGRVDSQRRTAAGRTSTRSSSCAQLNEAVYRDHPDVQVIAEESTSWPMVSRPVYLGRPRLRHEVEHGLDARHARLHAPGADLPQVPSRPADVLDLVRVLRELRAAAVARRSGARQGLADRQDAGRRVAAVRQPAPAVRLHVGASGQEAAVHGRRVRPAARMDARRRARMVGAAAIREHAGVQRWVRGPQRALSRASRRCTRSTSTRPASSGSTATTPTRACSSFLRRPRDGPAGARRLQLHAGAARRTTSSACPRAATGASC